MQEVSCLISFMHFSTGSDWLVSGCAFCLAHSVLMQSVCVRAETGGYEGWLETAIRGAVSPEKLDGLSFLFTVSSADSHTAGIITYQPGNTHTHMHTQINFLMCLVGWNNMSWDFLISQAKADILIICQPSANEFCPPPTWRRLHPGYGADFPVIITLGNLCNSTTTRGDKVEPTV